MAYTEKQLMKLLHEQSLINQRLSVESGRASKALLDRLNVRMARIQKKIDDYPKKANDANKQHFEAIIVAHKKVEEEEAVKAIKETVREYMTQQNSRDRRVVREAQRELRALDKAQQNLVDKRIRQDMKIEVLEDFIDDSGVLHAVPDRVLEKYLRGSVLKLPRGIKPHMIEALFEEGSSIKNRITRVDNLPVTVKVLGDNVFNGCTSLKTLKLPPTLEIVGKAAIANCPSLVDVYIPASVNLIGQGAFQNSHIKYMTITPVSTSQMGIESQRGLSTLYVPEGIAESVEGAFVGAVIGEFRVGMNNKTYSAVDGNLYNKSGDTLIAYANGKTNESIALGEKVVAIADYAFSGATNLTSIKMGKNVKLIGASAFENLGDINMAGEHVNRSLDISECSDVVVGDRAFKNAGLTDAKGVDKIEVIGEEAFAGNRGLTGDLVTNAKVIHDRAFAGTGYKTAHLRGDMEYIGSEVFAGSDIENLILENMPKSIAGDAFYGMAKLLYADMPHEMFLDKNGKLLHGAALLARVSSWFKDSKNFQKLQLHAAEKNIRLVPATLIDKKGRERSWFMSVSEEEYNKMQETGETHITIDNREGKREVTFSKPTQEEVGEQGPVEQADYAIVERETPDPAMGIPEEDKVEGTVITASVDINPDTREVSIMHYQSQDLVEESETQETEHRMTQKEADLIANAYAISNQKQVDPYTLGPGETEELVQTLVQTRTRDGDNH